VSIRSCIADSNGSEAVPKRLHAVHVWVRRYVDEGGNVNQYTAEVFKACDRDNQVGLPQ